MARRVQPGMFGMPTWVATSLLVVVSVGGVFLVVLVMHLTGVSPDRALDPKSSATPRPEFTRSVVGKTTVEVMSIAGRPNRTGTAGGGQTEYWYYDGRTVDPITGKVDYNAQVVFKDGKATQVNY